MIEPSRVGGRQRAEGGPRASADFRIPPPASRLLPPARRDWLVPVLLTPVLFLVGAILKVPETMLPMGTDTGMYAYYARSILNGGRPYVDFWDVHPPLVFYYWAVVQTIAGADWTTMCAGSRGVFEPVPCIGLVAHVLDLLLTIVTALLVYATARQVGGSVQVAAFAALLCTVFANVSMISGEGSIPGKLVLVPATLAVWSYLRDRHASHAGWALLSGAAAAGAVLAKQPGLMVFAALGAHALWETATGLQPKQVLARRWLGLAAGGALVFTMICGYLWWIGSLGGFLEQAWGYNLERLFRGHWHSVEGLRAPELGLHHIFRDAAGLLLVGAAAGGLALGLSPTQPVQRLLLFWAAADLVTILGFLEFAQVVPSFALLAAFGMGRVWDSAGRGGLGLGHPLAGRLLVVVVFGSIFILSSGRQAAVTLRAWNDRGPQGWKVAHELLSDYLHKDAPPGPLFIWGNTYSQLYALSGRQAASPFLNTEALGSFSPGYERSRQALMRQLESAQPMVVITAPDSDLPAISLDRFPALRQFIESCYRREEPFAHLRDEWGISIRETSRPGCGPGESPS